MFSCHNRRLKKLLISAQSIPGWLSLKEGLFLYKKAKKIPEDGVVVEIGSYCAKSTIFLGQGIRKTKGAMIYAIDPHVGSPEKEDEYKNIDTFPQFQNNLKKFGLEEKVTSIRKTSEEASLDFSGKIDLLFIDGSHIKKDVEKDFKNWVPKVKKGGFITIHDVTSLPGPWQATKKYIFFSPFFKKIGLISSIVFATFDPSKNPEVKLKNRLLNFFSYLFVICYVRMRKIRKTIFNFQFSIFKQFPKL